MVSRFWVLLDENVVSRTRGYSRLGECKPMAEVMSRIEVVIRKAMGRCTVLGWMGWLLVPNLPRPTALRIPDMSMEREADEQIL